MPKIVVVAKSIFPCLHCFPEKKRERKEQQCDGPFQLRFSITHSALIFPLPVARRAPHSVFCTLIALHYFLLKNKFAPKKKLYTYAVCCVYSSAINEWCVHFYASYCALFFVVVVVIFYSHSIFFSRTLTVRSEREIESEKEKKRASSISISDEL